MQQFATKSVFTRELVEWVSKAGNEPDWLLKLRLEAFEAFERQPMELPKDSPIEKYYTDLRKLDLNKYAPLNGKSDSVASSSFPAEVAQQTKRKDFSTLAMHNGQSILAYPQSLGERGVVFTDLRSAAREHAELVRRHLLSKCINASEHKLTALNAALWVNGAFLYVPKNTEVVLPFKAVYSTDASGKGAFYQTLIVLEEGAKAVFADEYTFTTPANESLHSALTEVIVGKNACLEFYSQQSVDNSLTFNYDVKKALVEADATCNWVCSSLGGKLNLSKVESVLVGKGANSNNLGVFLGREAQHVDVSSNVNHVVGMTNTKILTKGAITGRTTSVYRGMIDMSAVANHSNSDLKGTTLVLSREARANAIPSLAIFTNDVKAKHAAFVDHLDEEQLFYLMSRGLERKQAEREIVDGYFAQVLDEIKLAEVRERFKRAIGERLVL